jgi:hypothetical protein
MTNPFLAIAAAAGFLAGAAADAQTGAPTTRPDYTVFVAASTTAPSTDAVRR